VSTTGLHPEVGSRLRAVADHDIRLAVADGPIVSIPRGTSLEIVSLDERWDNQHASIARFGRITANLCVLDGPSAGEEIALVITGDAVPRSDGGESETWMLPDWLVPASHA
jgi:hypothetical protein